MSKPCGFTVQDACATIVKAMQEAKAVGKPLLNSMIEQEEDGIKRLNRAIGSGTVRGDDRIRADESLAISKARLHALRILQG